jgi:hypothetical protein
MKLVILTVLKQLIKGGYIPYVHILRDNIPSKNMFSSFKFEEMKGYEVTWVACKCE